MSYGSPVDEWTRLALAARAGDEDARVDFVRATHADVWRLCAHLGDRDAADDLTQECYLRVFRSLHGYRGEAPVRSWLFSIVRRVAADDIGARQRHRRRPTAHHQRSGGEDHSGRITLVALLDELDPDRRTAFVLTQVLGFSYVEAAALCDCPVGTIRSRVSRARESLVEMLGDEPDVSCETA
jgi:RNA polymerase sigma-70 factor (ECF subfamily)